MSELANRGSLSVKSVVILWQAPLGEAQTGIEITLRKRVE